MSRGKLKFLRYIMIKGFIQWDKATLKSLRALILRHSAFQSYLKMLANLI